MITIWHNPRCSKSRATLELLRENGYAPRVRHYLQDPPDSAELRAVLALLGMQPAQIIRTKEALFKDLGLAPDTAPEALILAMAAHPALIERPIVLTGTAAALGRPPEAVLAIL